MAIMNLDLNLSEESRGLLDKLPIDEVVMLVRHDDFPPFHDVRRSIDYRRKFDFKRRRSTRESLKRLGKEMKSELRRLDMIRDDFYGSERFILSANIIALRQMVAEKSSRGLSYYYDSKDYVNRLIRRLDNDKYESWQGYDDDTVTRVKELLSKTLTSTEYEVICMRFGLNDGRCREWQEIAQHFGWESKGGPAYHEKNAISKLYGVIDEFKKLTKLS